MVEFPSITNLMEVVSSTEFRNSAEDFKKKKSVMCQWSCRGSLFAFVYLFFFKFINLMLNQKKRQERKWIQGHNII